MQGKVVVPRGSLGGRPAWLQDVATTDEPTQHCRPHRAARLASGYYCSNCASKGNAPGKARICCTPYQ